MQHLEALMIVALLAASGCGAEEIPAAMVYVPGGTFDMGRPGGADNPVHYVQLGSFFMARHEVTVGEWKGFAEATGAPRRWDSARLKNIVGRGSTSQLPDEWAMFSLTWYEAITYCNWRSRQEGLSPAYSYDEEEMRAVILGRRRTTKVDWERSADGYRLPTEAEWEYAARGGSVGEGRPYARGASLADVAWYLDNAGWEVHPVGQKMPNVLGLYDVLGNAGEWCWDYYDAEYYRASPEHDPVGPETWYDPGASGGTAREVRVSRGGTWMDDAAHCTEVFRFRPDALYSDGVGIRLVRSAK